MYWHILWSHRVSSIVKRFGDFFFKCLWGSLSLWVFMDCYKSWDIRHLARVAERDLPDASMEHSAILSTSRSTCYSISPLRHFCGCRCGMSVSPVNAHGLPSRMAALFFLILLRYFFRGLAARCSGLSVA